MNTLENTILVLNPDGSKYGWTKNVIAKNIYEVLKNENQLMEYMSQYPETYAYMLKYFIQKGLSTKFKKYFECAKWTEENKQVLEYLLSTAAKYNRASIFFYLVEKYHSYFDFNNIEKIRYYLYDVDDKLQDRHYDILDYCARVFVNNNNLDKLPFGVMCSLSTIIHYNNEPLLNKVYSIMEAFSTFFDKKIDISFLNAAKILGITYKNDERN